MRVHNTLSASISSLALIVLVAAMTGCSRNNVFRDRLQSLDSALVSSPDSVFSELAGMEPDVRQQSVADRMYYELLRADAQNKAYIDFTTDSVMKCVAEYYDDHGSANEKMRAYYLLGCTYRDMNDAPMELQCFQEATEKADTTKKDCDLYTLYAIYGQMADIYHNQYLPEEELEAQKMCEKIAWMNKDTLNAINAYVLQIRSYDLKEDTVSIMGILSKAYDLYMSRKDTVNASRLLDPIINIHIRQQKWEQVDREHAFFVKHSRYFNSEGNIINQDQYSYYYEKGMILLHHNKHDSAFSCFTNLLPFNKEAAYHGFLSIYEKSDQADSIAKYAKLFAAANDSSHIGKNSIVIAQMTSMYNYSRQEKIAKERTIETANARAMTLAISGIALFCLFASLVTIAILRRKSKERERIHKEQEKMLLRRYNSTIDTISKLEKEKDALAFDNAKIERLQKTITKFENEKHELEKKLREFNQITDDVDFKAWYENFIDCDASNKLRAKTIISPNFTVKIEDELWEELRLHIKNNCPEFLAVLDAYSLNPTYQKIVLLNTFDFTNSEISILLNKTKQQISNIHNRLSKKMFPSSSNTRKLKQNIQEILRDKKN